MSSIPQGLGDNPSSRGTFFLLIFPNYLKRHYVLIEFLFFRPDFVFSVLDVTRVEVLYTDDVVGKRKNPTLCDRCLLGCFAGDGFVAVGVGPKTT